MLNAAIWLRSGVAQVGAGNSANNQDADYLLFIMSMEGAVGDPEEMKHFQNRLQSEHSRISGLNNDNQNAKASKSGSSVFRGLVGNGRVFFEGKSYSFKQIIDAIVKSKPEQKSFIHASGSDSVVGSFDKDGQGLAFGLDSSGEMLTKNPRGKV